MNPAPGPKSREQPKWCPYITQHTKRPNFVQIFGAFFEYLFWSLESEVSKTAKTHRAVWQWPAVAASSAAPLLFFALRFSSSFAAPPGHTTRRDPRNKRRHTTRPPHCFRPYSTLVVEEQEEKQRRRVGWSPCWSPRAAFVTCGRGRHPSTGGRAPCAVCGPAPPAGGPRSWAP